MTPRTRLPGDEGASGRRVSMLRLERHLLGEGSAEERAALRREMLADAELAELVRRMEATRSSLRWAKVRSRLPAAPRLAVLIDLLARMAGFLNPVRPAMAWGWACAAILLALPAALRFGTATPEFHAKGAGGPEVAAVVAGARMRSGDTASAGTGDILAFTYRSDAPIYARIWYAEDGGALRRYEGSGDTSFYWEASPSWIPAPHRVRLEGRWRIQRVVILAASRKVDPTRALRIAQGAEAPGDAGRLFTYTLIQP